MNFKHLTNAKNKSVCKGLYFGGLNNVYWNKDKKEFVKIKEDKI